MVASDVWSFFKDKTPKSAVCLICLKNEKSVKDSTVERNDNTTRLWRHSDDDHKDDEKYAKYAKAQQEMVKQLQTKLQFQKNTLINTYVVPTKDIIDAHIADLIILDCQPYSIVKDTGFMRLIKLAFPKYELPGRDYFTDKISTIHKIKVAQLKKKFEMVEYASLTTDTWTSTVNDGFITITAHYIDKNHVLNTFVLDTQSFGNVSHTSDNLSIYIQAATTKWNLENKIVGIVTDNASNITTAITYSNNNSIRCAAHTLQLCVSDLKDDHKEIEAVLSKCRSIVGHFKRSPKAYQVIKEYQETLNIKQHMLIQEVSTRWNSSYYMVERLIEQKAAIGLYFINHETNVEQLTPQDWRIMENLIGLLEPLESATVELSGDKYCSLSMVIPVVTQLGTDLKKVKIDQSFKTIRDALVARIRLRFQNVEKNKFFCNSVLLDPRYKNTCFTSESMREKAVKNLLEEVEQQQKKKQQQQEQPSSASETTEPPAKKRRRLADFVREQQLGRQQPSELACSIEVNNYLAEQVIEIDDILSWWSNNKTRYPNVYALITKYLCIPATSCPSERVFSTAGEIVSQRRSRLTSEHVNELIFLNHNSQFLI